MSSRVRRNEGGLQQYEYTRLKDAAVRIKKNVNFYGVIREYEHPRPSKGSDAVCTMTVMDMSFSDPGMRVLVFASAAGDLPLVKSVGDIIRFHRVHMDAFNGSPQAVAKVDRKSAFFILEGKDGQGYEPYQVSHKSYSFEHQDEKIINLLRVWIGSYPLGSGASKYLVPISHIVEGAYFDLCCKILYIDDRKPEHAVLMHVWDGSDYTAFITAGHFCNDSLLPLRRINKTMCAVDCRHEVGALETYNRNLYSAPLPPRLVLCSFPPVGTVVTVISDILTDDLPGHFPVCGDWVKFRNLTSRIHGGMIEGMFVRESKISLLSAESDLVKKCESSYQERLTSEDGRLPQSSPRPPQSITVTDYEHVPFSTLREVLAFPEVTYKFRCLVRVIATWPSEVLEFCGPSACKETKEEAGLPSTELPHYVYAVQLTLEDPTARIQAYLYGVDGAKFFNGHPAAKLQSQSATVGALERKVQKLLGVKSSAAGEPAPRDPPWIKCCIMSYYADKENPWDSRTFRIFGTTLPG